MKKLLPARNKEATFSHLAAPVDKRLKLKIATGQKDSKGSLWGLLPIPDTQNTCF